MFFFFKKSIYSDFRIRSVSILASTYSMNVLEVKWEVLFVPYDSCFIIDTKRQSSDKLLRQQFELESNLDLGSHREFLYNVFFYNDDKSLTIEIPNIGEYRRTTNTSANFQK